MLKITITIIIRASILVRESQPKEDEDEDDRYDCAVSLICLFQSNSSAYWGLLFTDSKQSKPGSPRKHRPGQ